MKRTNCTILSTTDNWTTPIRKYSLCFKFFYDVRSNVFIRIAASRSIERNDCFPNAWPTFVAKKRERIFTFTRLCNYERQTIISLVHAVISTYYFIRFESDCSLFFLIATNSQCFLNVWQLYLQKREVFIWEVTLMERFFVVGCLLILLEFFKPWNLIDVFNQIGRISRLFWYCAIYNTHFLTQRYNSLTSIHNVVLMILLQIFVFYFTRT